MGAINAKDCSVKCKSLKGSLEILKGIQKRLLGLVLALMVAPVGANGELRIHFAGTAIIGEFEGQDVRYPNVTELLSLEDERGASLVDSLIFERIKAANTGLNFRFGELADYRDGNAIAVALAIDWENTSTTSLDGNTKYVVDIHGQVLAFDYSSMKVVGAFPIGVQMRDAHRGAPSRERVRQLARRALIGEGDFGLLARFVETLSRIELKRSYANRIQVVDADISPEVSVALDKLGLDGEEFAARVGQNFSKYLSSNQTVPVLPFKKGVVIGNKMAAQFTNGDIYQLTVPEPDYTVGISIDRLRKLELDRTSSQIAYLYGLYATIAVQQPLLERFYADHQFKFAVSSTIPVGVPSDDAAAFEELVLSSLNSFTNQISDPQRSWLEKWAVTDGMKDAFLEVNDVLSKCR